MTQWIKMPFGKHRGVPIDEVPRSYLTWLQGQKLSKELASHVNARLAGERPPQRDVRPQRPWRPGENEV